MVFGGMCDFIVQIFVSGGSGIIVGGVNVMFKFCVCVWNFYVEGKKEEVVELQKVFSKGDWLLIKVVIVGMKYVI